MFSADNVFTRISQSVLIKKEMYAMFLKILVLFCAAISTVRAQIFDLTDDSVISIVCTYQDECDKEDMFIRGESGYKILINVTFVDINGHNGDYLLIKSGNTLDDGLTGRVFTHNIKNPRQYVSLKEEILIHFVANGPYEKEPSGFVLTAEHYGEQITTLPPITTERPWPIPSEEDTPFIRVNLTVHDFKAASISSFQEIVAQLANDYVDIAGLILEEPISPENVQVNQTTRCPDYYPNAEDCVQILFALPVFLAEESLYYGTYQLNHTLLERMWKDASKYMTDPSFELYKSPNGGHVILLWMLIFCSIPLLYGLFYFVSGYECTGYIIRRKRRRDEERQQFAHTDDERSNSIVSMSPHPFQPMPALFDCDMTYYDPDSPVTLRHSGRTANRTEHEDAHDTLDSTNLNVRTFSFNGQNLEEVTET